MQIQCDLLYLKFTLWDNYKVTRGSRIQEKKQAIGYGAVKLCSLLHTTHLWWEYS